MPSWNLLRSKKDGKTDRQTERKSRGEREREKEIREKKEEKEDEEKGKRKEEGNKKEEGEQENRRKEGKKEGKERRGKLKHISKQWWPLQRELWGCQTPQTQGTPAQPPVLPPQAQSIFLQTTKITASFAIIHIHPLCCGTPVQSNSAPQSSR